jgi:transcriptional regulator with GAF, ATPase, and Fis domain
MISGKTGCLNCETLKALSLIGATPQRDPKANDMAERKPVQEKDETGILGQGRMIFERFLSDLSKKFIALPADEVDANIETGLKIVTELLNGDRAALLEFSEDRKELHVTHSWSVEGIDQVGPLFISRDFPYCADKWLKNEIFSWSKISELPEEAKLEMEYAESQGLKSMLGVPFSCGGSMVGVLTIGMIRAERTWSPELVERLKLVAEIFSHAMIRRQNQLKINKLVRFEKLLSELSVNFVNVPETEIDREIDRALQRLLEALEVERVTLFEFNEDQSILYVTHSHAAPPVPINPIGAFSDKYPNYTKFMAAQKKPTFLRVPEDLPEETKGEYDLAVKLGMKSYLLIPLRVGNRMIGSLGFPSFKTAHPVSQDRIRQYRLVGELFANLLDRKRKDERLCNAFSEIKQLKARLEEENLYLREEIDLKHAHKKIIGQSRVIKHVLRQVEQVAETDAAVLILGETGTGKELIAREIHRLSSRKGHSMITVNCAALPSTLVESELFGREKGAYTGALSKQVGRFEVADGSTLFLDEIGELSTELQAKLLRVLQEGQFERLGSSKPIHVNVRIIAATNRNLEDLVQKGRFRQDLYYRLKVFPISLPPLRERAEDIPELIWLFIKEYGKLMGKQIKTVSRKSMEEMKHYPWPGNVRELRNVIEHAMIITKGQKLNLNVPEMPNTKMLSLATMEKVERNHVLNVLKHTNWRIKGKNGAAEILGLKPSTLYTRMNRLGIRRERK